MIAGKRMVVLRGNDPRSSVMNHVIMIDDVPHGLLLETSNVNRCELELKEW